MDEGGREDGIGGRPHYKVIRRGRGGRAEDVGNWLCKAERWGDEKLSLVALTLVAQLCQEWNTSGIVEHLPCNMSPHAFTRLLSLVFPKCRECLRLLG